MLAHRKQASNHLLEKVIRQCAEVSAPLIPVHSPSSSSNDPFASSEHSNSEQRHELQDNSPSNSDSDDSYFKAFESER